MKIEKNINLKKNNLFFKLFLYKLFFVLLRILIGIQSTLHGIYFVNTVDALPKYEEEKTLLYECFFVFKYKLQNMLLKQIVQEEFLRLKVFLSWDLNQNSIHHHWPCGLLKSKIYFINTVHTFQNWNLWMLSDNVKN